MTFPFAPLKMFGYDLIMADPPWSFETWSAKGHAKAPQGHYDCMDLAAIKALPVDSLARGDALLWLWATHPMLPQALEVMRAWNRRFVTSGVWVKKTTTGKLAFGTGYRLRSASEPFLIGTWGNPMTAPVVRTAIEGRVRAHSRKPEEAFREAERMMPRAFRCELFSRASRSGWECWGDEAGKFDLPADEKEKAA
jgi:N6-adenosine-specific RNA methylase IME4